MPSADHARFAYMAKEQGLSFASWTRMALYEKARRFHGEKSGLLTPHAAPRPGTSRQVRIEGAAEGRVSSADYAVERERARKLAMEQRACTADTSFGTRCKLCGRFH